MASILLDQNVPIGLRRLLPGHDVKTAWELGWAEFVNGRLIDAAEEAGFNVMITADQSIQHQQDLRGRRLAFIILGSNNWPLIRRDVGLIVAAVFRAEPGTFQIIAFQN